MSELQKLGKELDYFHEDIKHLLPNYSRTIMFTLHELFVELINLPKEISPKEEQVAIQTIYKAIDDISQEWRGILSEHSY